MFFFIYHLFIYLFYSLIDRLICCFFVYLFIHSLSTVPEKTPTNATARATGPYTIHVTWSAISVVDARSFFGYRVLYFPVFNPRQLRDIIVSRNDIQTTITGLRPFTQYGVQIAAYSTQDGNYTTPLYAQTWQAGKRRIIVVYTTIAVDSHKL